MKDALVVIAGGAWLFTLERLYLSRRVLHLQVTQNLMSRDDGDRECAVLGEMSACLGDPVWIASL